MKMLVSITFEVETWNVLVTQEAIDRDIRKLLEEFPNSDGTTPTAQMVTSTSEIHTIGVNGA